jgi:hypothetical protein
VKAIFACGSILRRYRQGAAERLARRCKWNPPSVALEVIGLAEREIEPRGLFPDSCQSRLQHFSDIVARERGQLTTGRRPNSALRARVVESGRCSAGGRTIGNFALGYCLITTVQILYFFYFV